MCTSPGDSWRSTSSLDDLTVGEHLVVSDLIPLKLLVLAVYRVKRSRRRRRWKLRKGMNAIQRAPLGYKSPLEKRNEPFRWRLNSNDVERYILQPMKNFFLSLFFLYFLTAPTIDLLSDQIVNNSYALASAEPRCHPNCTDDATSRAVTSANLHPQLCPRLTELTGMDHQSGQEQEGETGPRHISPLTKRSVH